MKKEILWLLPFTLFKFTKEWFDQLPDGSITSWLELEYAFLSDYFPRLLFVRKGYKITTFRQKYGESLNKAHKDWKRF